MKVVGMGLEPRPVPEYLKDEKFLSRASVSMLCQWMLDVRTWLFWPRSVAIGLADLLLVYERIQSLLRRDGCSEDEWFRLGEECEAVTNELRAVSLSFLRAETATADEFEAFAAALRVLVERLKRLES